MKLDIFRGHTLFLLVVPAASVILLSYHLRKKARTKLPLPPGPKGLPLIKNLLQVPIENPWKVYNEWSKQYGDIIYLEAMGQPIVVLNSLESINGILVSRASNNSNRPSMPLVDIMEVGWSMSLLNYGQSWRGHRRWFHRLLNRTQVHRYHHIIEQEVPVFLETLLSDPHEFYENTRSLFGSIIMRASYGREEWSYNKHLVASVETLVQNFMEYATPGRLLVNTFHSMKHIPAWLPGAGWKRSLLKLRELSKEVTANPFMDAKARRKAGIQDDQAAMVTEMMATLPEEQDPSYLDKENLVKYVAAQAYVAGADTTVSSAYTLILALAMHPEVQDRAQSEIDLVVGSDRLPNMADILLLPYVQAIIKEVNRWHTVIPLCLPHVSKQDDVYRGYHIPANTIILPNSWAIMHDPMIFEEPMKFKPERYIKDGKINAAVLDPEAGAFGYGRRICPGRHFSNDALTLLALSLLSCFKIKPSVDKEGNPIPLNLEFSPSSLISTPLPFECDIKARSQQHEALIRNATSANRV